jgi:hypothetical protein
MGDGMSAPWVVNIKGGPALPFEIAVVRSDYELGLKSCGWFESDRKLFVSGSSQYGKDSVTEEIFDKLVSMAHERTNELNAYEANK